MSLVSLIMLGALLSLGNWQIKRLTEKEELLRSIELRIHHPPLNIETYVQTLLGQDYWPVKLSGVFHHDSERHLFSTHDGQSGYFIYTPFEVEPLDFIFINRGFVPFDKKKAATREGGQTSGIVHITGLARSVPNAKQIRAMLANDPVQNIFYSKDLTAMQISAKLPKGAVVRGLFVDADKASTPTFGMPQGGVTYIQIPNDHLQYAITWFGLAGALLCVWGALAWRQYLGKVA
jgi:surfeit locus 1 family protein